MSTAKIPFPHRGVLSKRKVHRAPDRTGHGLDEPLPEVWTANRHPDTDARPPEESPMAAPNLTDEFMGEYVREHRCYAALRSVSIADWDRGVREIERAERARIFAALPAALANALPDHTKAIGFDHRPTGPATAAGHEMLEHFDPKSGPCHLSQAGARSIVLAIEGQTAARIFAALPAALHEHAVQHRDALPCNELCAAALLAAIEKELAKDW